MKIIKLFYDRAQWLTLLIPALWEAKASESLEPWIGDQPRQHGKTPSLQKIQKFAGHSDVCL